MTATDKIRRMLDERGVKYRTHGTTDRTWFEVGNISWFIIERENGSLTADAVYLTPEQAIAVTLGREPDDAVLFTKTCRMISAPQYGEGCQECSACGEVLDGYLFDGGHCPNCGAKVVDE